MLRTDQLEKPMVAPAVLTNAPATFDSSAYPPVDQPIVLIADDEPAIGGILERLFRPYATMYDIRVITNPLDALECIEGGRVRLVITDFNMPGMNGLQLTTAVKRRSPRTAVVLITAYATSILKHLAGQHQVDYYLPKPFRLTELEQAIAAALTPCITD